MNFEERKLPSDNIIICAVIFGTDETLLKIKLSSGYQFKKMSLIPTIDNLDLIFDITDMGLRREYEFARIDDELNVLCAYKEIDPICFQNFNNEEKRTFYNNEFTVLDNDIRTIRLIKEGPVRFKTFAFNYSSDSQGGYRGIVTIPEAIRTKEISKFSCTDDEAEKIINFIPKFNRLKDTDFLNNCFVYYDLSYHNNNSVAITLLTTCLEMLFIESNSAIKEPLSKRCSVFLYDTQTDRQDCYNRLRELYKKRSDFVHDGKKENIDNDDILYLRDCVRKSILKYFDIGIDKKKNISKLLAIIEGLDYFKQAVSK